jgi:uncharacterized protein (DUF1015 family)
MAGIRPFPALRPRPDFAARIASVPYDVVDVDEARALAHDPLSFLHVSRAEIDLPSETDPYGDEVYARAAASFEALKANALEQDAEPALYIYRLQMDQHVQTGVAGCFSVNEYRGDTIKRHETTRPDKETDRTRHILATRAQSGPVLLTYRELPEIDDLVAAEVTEPPLYDFVAADGVRHAVWRARPEGTDALVDAFSRVPTLYIADGHHRAASAARAHDHDAEQSRSEHPASALESGWFLTVAFPGREMQVLPYHRVVRDLGDRTPAELIDRVRDRLPLTPGRPNAVRKGTCGMYLDGGWHTLRLDAGVTAPTAAALDVQLLQDQVLAPLLGITDPRTNPRIGFVGGIRGTGELVRLVDRGEAAVAFAMAPTDLSDVMAISDKGGVMPPKSTWFEPKLRDGLLVHLI